MAMADTINSIRTHLEDDYTALEQLGVSVEDRNIENIKDMANQIYAKFPKTDYAEGSNITLSNTLKGKLDFEDGIVGIGNTKQNSYEGYNLTNIYSLHDIGFSATTSGITYTWLDGGKIKVNGTASADAYISISKDLNVTSGTTYRGSGCPSGGSTSSYILQFLDLSTAFYIGTNSYDAGSGVSFTPIADKTCLIRLLVKSGTTCNNLILEPMITLGSTQKTFEPYVGGTASPNPTYPQDIEVVRGKNLFGDTLRQGVTNYQTGTYNADNTIRITTTNWLTLPKGTYTISAKNSANKLLQISNITFDTNGNYYEISGTTGQWENMPFTITFPQDTKWQCNIGYSDGSTITPSQVSEIQIEKGSQATSYLPYNTLEVVERGKNLLDKTQVVGNNTATTVTQINTGFRVSAETLGYAGVTTIDVKANTNYFLKFNTNVIVDSGAQKYVRIFAGTTQTTTIATYTFTEGGGTFNTGNNTKINIWFYCSLGGSGTVDYTNVQLQEGSTATSYEPYQTPQTYQLSLGEYEFAKTVNYADTIEYDVDEDKVYKDKAINKVSLKTLTWEISLAGTNSYGTASLLSYIGKVATNINIICSHATGIIFNDRNWFTNTTIYDETNGYVVFRNTSFTSLEDFTTFLNNNNVYAYYVLATATREEITGTLKDQIKALYNSQSFTGTTIIEIDGQLPLIIKVRALKGE